MSETTPVGDEQTKLPPLAQKEGGAATFNNEETKETPQSPVPHGGRQDSSEVGKGSEVEEGATRDQIPDSTAHVQRLEALRVQKRQQAQDAIVKLIKARRQILNEHMQITRYKFRQGGRTQSNSGQSQPPSSQQQQPSQSPSQQTTPVVPDTKKVEKVDNLPLSAPPPRQVAARTGNMISKHVDAVRSQIKSRWGRFM